MSKNASIPINDYRNPLNNISKRIKNSLLYTFKINFVSQCLFGSAALIFESKASIRAFEIWASRACLAKKSLSVEFADGLRFCVVSATPKAAAKRGA